MDLTKKGNPFVCTKSCGNAISIFKQQLVSEPILKVFDLTLVTEVWCNASKLAFGAALV